MEFALILVPLYASIRLAGASAESVSEFVGGTLFWLFAITSTSVVIAGLSGVLGYGGVLAALIIWFGISFLAKPKWEAISSSFRDLSRIDILASAIVLWMLVLIVSAGWHYPPTPYDAYVYHLTFPARWLQAKSIFIVPTPFGDPASAYAPANGSAFYAYLMLLAGDDKLCRAGELIFWLISLFAVYRLCALFGVAKVWRYAAVFAFGFSKETLFQAGSSEVDLIVAACGLWAFLSLVRSAEDDAKWLPVLGVSLGLGIGTKYVAAPLYLPLMVMAVPLLWKRYGSRLLWPLCLLVAFGGVWYMRNLMETANPIFPVQLDLFGATLFWGPITIDGMRESAFHIRSWDYKLAALLLLFGKNSWICFIWPIIAGLISALVLGSRWVKAAAVWAIAGIAIHLELVPYNSQYRFLIVILAILWAVSIAGIARLPRALRYLFAAPVALGILSTLIGNPLELDFTLPKLSLLIGGSGILISSAWPLAAASLAWLIFVAVRIKSRSSAMTAVILSSAVWLIAWVNIPSHQPILKLGKTTFYESDASSVYAELWKSSRPHRIAYTGHNSFYPLFAPDSRHTAFHVNATGGPFWKYHDLASWWKSSGTPLPPLPDKPALYRLRADKDTWLRNLRVLKSDLIAVYKLSPFEEKYIEHDELGFPAERAWLESMPERFKPAFESEELVVYRLSP